MKASDFIIDFFVNNDNNKVFGYIGGTVAHIYDSVDVNDNIEIINMITEQGAGFAAEGFARSTGKLGLAIATSGPGATNLITPVGSCFFDSIPVLFITGQVNTYEYKYDQSIRQMGFQETNIVDIVKPITKYAKMIQSISELKYELEKACFLAQHGRKGPVLIDIPMNIQRENFNPNTAISFYDSDEYKNIKQHYDLANIDQIVQLLNDSRRPLLLIGGGCRSANADAELNIFLQKTKLPVVYSLMGKDVVKDSYPHNLGLIGSYGNRYGNLALANADLIIVAGSRLDSRQTGTNVKTFAREAKIVHVDIDRSELCTKIKTDLAVLADIKLFFQTLQNYTFKLNTTDWLECLEKYKEKFPSTVSINGQPKIPNCIISTIAKLASDDDLVCVDVGQHQMWVAQSFNTKGKQRILFSGGMGSMGFALPAAIGVALGNKNRVIVIVGDGGFQMNIQELEIIKRRNLSIKIFILNNLSLGMVRQFQEIYFNSRYIGTKKDYSSPHFENIGMAYGIKSKTVLNTENISVELQKSLENNQAEIVDIHLTDTMTTVEPKLIVNKPIEDMYPFLDKTELQKLMIIKTLDE
jgi:acetolactate synthase-1/2/3 large subunit